MRTRDKIMRAIDKQIIVSSAGTNRETNDPNTKASIT
jgi:hypothetical protein